MCGNGLSRLIVIISQYIQIMNQYVIHLRLIYVNYISKKFLIKNFWRQHRLFLGVVLLVGIWNLPRGQWKEKQNMMLLFRTKIWFLMWTRCPISLRLLLILISPWVKRSFAGSLRNRQCHTGCVSAQDRTGGNDLSWKEEVWGWEKMAWPWLTHETPPRLTGSGTESPFLGILSMCLLRHPDPWKRPLYSFHCKLPGLEVPCEAHGSLTAFQLFGDFRDTTRSSWLVAFRQSHWCNATVFLRESSINSKEGTTGFQWVS